MFTPSNAIFDDAGPFQVAGISTRLARAASDSEELIALARALLRADAATTHTDVARTHAKRIGVVNTALNDLKDEPPVLAAMARAYQTLKLPLETEIAHVRKEINGSLETAEWFRSHAAELIGAWAEVPGNHLIRERGVSIQLVDPFASIQDLAQRQRKLRESRNAREDQAYQDAIENHYAFPSEQARRDFEREVIRTRHLDNHLDSPERWVTDTLLEKHPDVAKKMESKELIDFPPDLLAFYRAEYEKSDAKPRYRKMLDQVVLDDWKYSKDREAVEDPLNLDHEDSADREMKKVEQEFVLSLGKLSKDLTEKHSFVLELGIDGEITRVEGTARNPIANLTILGTISGSAEGSGNAEDPGVGGTSVLQDVLVSCLGLSKSSLDTPGTFSKSDFANFFLGGGYHRFSNSLRVTERAIYPIYLIGLVTPAQGDPFFTILGEACSVTPLQAAAVDGAEKKERTTAPSKPKKSSVKKRATNTTADKGDSDSRKGSQRKKK